MRQLTFVDQLLGQDYDTLAEENKAIVDAADEIYSYYDNEPFHAHFDVIENECEHLFPHFHKGVRLELVEWAASNFPDYLHGQ